MIATDARGTQVGTRGLPPLWPEGRQMLAADGPRGPVPNGVKKLPSAGRPKTADQREQGCHVTESASGAKSACCESKKNNFEKECT